MLSTSDKNNSLHVSIHNLFSHAGNTSTATGVFSFAQDYKIKKRTGEPCPLFMAANIDPRNNASYPAMLGKAALKHAKTIATTTSVLERESSKFPCTIRKLEIPALLLSSVPQVAAPSDTQGWKAVKMSGQLQPPLYLHAHHTKARQVNEAFSCLHSLTHVERNSD